MSCLFDLNPTPITNSPIDKRLKSPIRRWALIEQPTLFPWLVHIHQIIKSPQPKIHPKNKPSLLRSSPPQSRYSFFSLL